MSTLERKDNYTALNFRRDAFQKQEESEGEGV